jgi:hypothetical protein
VYGFGKGVQGFYAQEYGMCAGTWLKTNRNDGTIQLPVYTHKGKQRGQYEITSTSFVVYTRIQW